MTDGLRLNRLHGHTVNEVMLVNVCFASPFDIPFVNVFDSENSFVVSNPLQVVVHVVFALARPYAERLAYFGVPAEKTF